MKPMMYKLKHYKGLLNLEKFTRIEKNEEESYEIVQKQHTGTVKTTTKSNFKPIIKFYTAEGYGGLTSSIEYSNVAERDEDYDIIVSLICQNKYQTFDIIKEQQSLSENYDKLVEQAKEFETAMEHVKTFMDKVKVKIPK